MKIETHRLILAAAPGMSAGVQAAYLFKTFHAAQTNDPVFASAREAEQGKLPQGRALLMPSVNVSANSTSNDLTTQCKGAFALLGGNNRYNSYGYSVTPAQPQLLQRNWWAYTEFELQVILAKAQKRAIKEQIAQAKRNLEVGTATITYTHEAQASHDLTVAQVAAQLAEKKVVRSIMNSPCVEDELC